MARIKNLTSFFGSPQTVVLEVRQLETMATSSSIRLASLLRSASNWAVCCSGVTSRGGNGGATETERPGAAGGGGKGGGGGGGAGGLQTQDEGQPEKVCVVRLRRQTFLVYA